ncbi:hypothetical protein L5515_012285 [Caenorhabditis briggsae]|uniref:Uncharacterized protein n=1 Tax=Caenorhabditis briggsae TaxID=6238 RepID=A0AAE9EYY8_CAEBR|nr:hypothetical protein L5515_012285 [Caenorhabditis briggsae]
MRASSEPPEMTYSSERAPTPTPAITTLPIRTVSEDQKKRAQTVSLIPLSFDIVFLVIYIALIAVYLHEDRHTPIQIHALHGTSATVKAGVVIGQAYVIKFISKGTYSSYHRSYTLTIKVSIFRLFIVAHDFILYSFRNSEGLKMETIVDWIGIWSAAMYMLYSIMVPILVWAYYYKTDEEVEMMQMPTPERRSRYSSMEFNEEERYYMA